MDIEKLKEFAKNPYVLGAVAASISLLALAKNYFNGGVCKVTRDLTGKVIVITGGNAGIGKATIEELAHQNCTIIFGARDINKSERFLRQIKGKKIKADIIFIPLDLADLETINQFVEKVNRHVEQVDILINNAAVFLLPKRTLTKQNFEMHMGVNHLGHFYLTHKLWSLINKAEKPRIINVSALAHRGFQFPFKKNIPLPFDDLHFANNNYDPQMGYIQSKIANILFTKELQRRMDAQGFIGYSYSLHPGVVRTQIDRDFPLALKMTKVLLFPLVYLFMKDMKHGAQTTLYTILEDQSKLANGGYYSDCKESQVSEFAGNMDNARRLWEISEQQLNINFQI